MSPTPTPHKNFLLIDADADVRVLLSAALLKTYPRAAIMECQDLDTALDLLVRHEFHAIISHRALGAEAERVIRTVCGLRPSVPLIAISSRRRTGELTLAGATLVLSTDEQDRLGDVVSEVLAPPAFTAVD